MPMAEADFNYRDFTHQGTAEADKSLLVKFFILPVQDTEKSLAEGRPIFKDKEHIDIKIPGKRDAGACRPATEADKRRFPDHYRAFKERISQENNVTGTPLTEWSLMSRSMAEELRFYHVLTVEQLATMADAQASRFMGLMPLKERAKLWLENAAKEKPMWEMDQKIRAQRQEIDELKEALSRVIAIQEGNIDPELNEKQQARLKNEAVKDAKRLAG